MEFTARCKAFSTEGIGNYKIRVGTDGTVSVYDSVAGHYATCHALSAATQRRLRKMAAEVK